MIDLVEMRLPNQLVAAGVVGVVDASRCRAIGQVSAARGSDSLR
jgi:hypothetical protein